MDKSSLKAKLKQIIIDNIIAMIIAFILMIVIGNIMPTMTNKIVKGLLYVVFFISFGIFGYNMTVLLNCKHLKRK